MRSADATDPLRLTLAALALAVAAPLAAQESAAPRRQPAAPAHRAPATPPADAPAAAPAATGRRRPAAARAARPAAPGAAPATPQQPQVMEIVKDTFGDWQVRCAPDGNECFMYQLALDAQKNPVAEVSILKLPEASEAEAGVTVVTPLGTLLTNGLVLQIDGGETRQYPFVWCSQVGCFSRFGLAKVSIDAMKRGKAGKISLVSVGAPQTARGAEHVADRLHRRLRRPRGAAEPAGRRRRARRAGSGEEARAAAGPAAAELTPAAEKPGRAEAPGLFVPGRVRRLVEAAEHQDGVHARRRRRRCDITAVTGRSRATFGTTSRSQSGSGSS